MINSKESVGIDDLNVYAGRSRVAFADIADARKAPAEVLENAGFDHRGILPDFEDPVTLAVNAARPVLRDMDDESIGLLLVSTETGIDFGKPISTYISSALSLPEYCRNMEVKHACYGGTGALGLASAWVATQPDPNAKALVVTSDIARCHLNDSVEYSGGLGACAMVVSRDPRLVTLFPSNAVATQEVYDVARPTPTTEYSDAVLSLSAFLDLLEQSWLRYRETICDRDLCEQFKHVVYHVPIVSLVEKAHQTLLELDSFEVTHAEITASFKSQVSPSLKFSREIANAYSGGVYVALAGLLSDERVTPNDAIGFFSYGSGACSEFFSGQVTGDAAARMRRHQISEKLAERRLVNFGEYELALLQHEKQMLAKDYCPDLTQLGGLYSDAYEGRQLLVLDEIVNHHRRYRWT
ncbi:MAG: hydroxymethylglutaryl-CoA synthase [Planctomycetota bacterium]